MPKQKSHKGLLKRIKITKSGLVRTGRPHSRHLKSNKSGTTVQTYRKRRYARRGDLGALEKILGRPLRSFEDKQKAAAAEEPAAASKKPAPTARKPAVATRN